MAQPSRRCVAPRSKREEAHHDRYDRSTAAPSSARPARWSSRSPRRRTGPKPRTNGDAARPPLKGDQLSSYISIDADGAVVAYYGKIDGGQGLGTAIAQMVAEEIDVAYERVRVVMGDSALTLDMGGASAAIGVSHGGTMLRRTAAETRRLLIEMASERAWCPRQ